MTFACLINPLIVVYVLLRWMFPPRQIALVAFSALASLLVVRVLGGRR